MIYKKVATGLLQSSESCAGPYSTAPFIVLFRCNTVRRGIQERHYGRGAGGG